jgi:hypothetical protein
LKVQHILCETELAQKELADLGLPSKVVPIPPYFDYEVKPLPDEFRVAVFLTGHSDFDKYCQEETLSIVRAMPDVQFAAYGDAQQDIDYPNLKHFKNPYGADWQKFVYENSAYFRLVRHDTRPMASDEFILAGRDVITNVPLPGVQLIDTAGKILINDWDNFGTGLNAYNWPDTKVNIVQMIRKLKGTPYEKGNREIIASKYRKVLDRQKYIDTIWGLTGISKEKELIHA